MADCLVFKVNDLVQEVESMKSMAARFMTAASIVRLDDLVRQLRYADGPFAWQIEKERPLLTEPCVGHYELKSKPEDHLLIGTVSFLWHLSPVGKSKKEVALTGNATTRIELIDQLGEAPESVGTWRMEVGADDSPGACFHVQILGEEKAFPFPSTLPIPRVPVFPPTPMAAMEFLLGELFQEEWRREVARNHDPSRRWRSIQVRRWEAFLGWQLKHLQDSFSSPLVALKAFPPADLFA